jgi:hypothetical protein
MQYNTNNLLCFHTNLFNTIEQVEKMIEDRNLTNFDPNIIWESKMEGRLKIWVDKDTHNILFWTQKGDKRGTICMSAHYLNIINNMKSICYDKKVREPKVEDDVPQIKTQNINSGDLNQSILNIILDKISSKGIQSLNDKEKDFLNKYSD